MSDNLCSYTQKGGGIPLVRTPLLSTPSPKGTPPKTPRSERHSQCIYAIGYGRTQGGSAPPPIDFRIGFLYIEKSNRVAGPPPEIKKKDQTDETGW